MVGYVMPCYYPLDAWRSRNLDDVDPKTGRHRLVFDVSRGLPSTHLQVPCGQCIGCRLDRSRKWAIRCVHEASLHAANCFITLTFSDSFPEYTYSLDDSVFVKFIKRLRERIRPINIRYFHCGEYGEELNRPHHHCCLFGFDFPDKIPWSRHGEYVVYRSPLLEDLWYYGHSIIGSLTFDSAAYVARYIMKKQIGESAESYYGDRVPEYVTMSRRPGIGREWFNLYKDDIYNYDQLVVKDGFILKPPRYYDNLFDVIDHERLNALKLERWNKAVVETPARLEARAKVVQLKIDKLARVYEQS